MYDQYEKFRQTCEKLMPLLFVAALILTGMSSAQHDIKNTLLFAVSAIGTAPIFHKEAWAPYICKIKGQG